MPREAKQQIQSALADFDNKNYDAALKKLLSLEEKLPGDPFVENLLGAAYTKKQDFAAAQKCFERALANQPGYFPAKFNIGELLFLQRNYTEALDFFQKMSQQDPRNELLQFKVFVCLMELGKKEEAETALKAIRFPGDTPAWHYAQAVWASRNGSREKADEYVTGARYIFGPKTAIFEESLQDIGIKTP